MVCVWHRAESGGLGVRPGRRCLPVVKRAVPQDNNVDSGGGVNGDEEIATPACRRTIRFTRTLRYHTDHHCLPNVTVCKGANCKPNTLSPGLGEEWSCGVGQAADGLRLLSSTHLRHAVSASRVEMTSMSARRARVRRSQCGQRSVRMAARCAIPPSGIASFVANTVCNGRGHEAPAMSPLHAALSRHS